MTINGVEMPNRPGDRIGASKEILSRAGIHSDEDSNTGNVVIQMYAPPGHPDRDENGMVEITIPASDKK